jgi:glycosyltransferase involved in cell wall biosynthesis
MRNQSMLERLPAVIVSVVNDRFIPSHRSQPYIYGVVQHVFHSANILAAAGVETRFLLYHRDESISRPIIERTTIWNAYTAVRLDFHFRMPDHVLIAAFARALACLDPDTPAADERWRPLVYFQTSALLPYLPDGYGAVITHHSPFVDDVTAALGPEGARLAFNWDHAKADHLSRTQQNGVRTLRERRAIVCAEISPIQLDYLRARRIQDDRVCALSQPLETELVERDALSPDVEQLLRALLAAPGDAPIAFTAVSRLDYFKNVELLVESCCQSLQQGTIAGALVVGGAPDDPERLRLRAMVPEHLRSSVIFVPKVPRTVLVSELFPRMAVRGVFVCSSRYDLVPYTVLEAARLEICTLVPASRFVGASAYVPPAFQFTPSRAGLCRALERIVHADNRRRDFAPVASDIRSATCDIAHLRGFEAAYTRIASAAPQRRSVGHQTSLYQSREELEEREDAGPLAEEPRSSL